MDDMTKTLIDNFLDFLSKEIHHRKEYHPIQFGQWKLKDNKITIHCFINNEPDDVYVDVREIKENRDHFLHLANNVLDQLAEKLKNHANAKTTKDFLRP